MLKTIAFALALVATSPSLALAADAPVHLNKRCGIHHLDLTYQLYVDGQPLGYAWGIDDHTSRQNLTAAADLLTGDNCTAMGWLNLEQAFSPLGSRCEFAWSNDHVKFFLDDQPYSIWIRWDQKPILDYLKASLDSLTRGACVRHGWTQRP